SDSLLLNQKTEATETEYNAQKALQELLLSITAKTEALKTQLVEDGLAQRLAAIKNEEAQEIQSVKSKNAEIVEAYKKAYPDKKVTTITATTDLATQQEVLGQIATT